MIASGGVFTRNGPTNRGGEEATIPSSRRDEDWLFACLPLIDLDGAYAFALFTGSLLSISLGTYGALLFSCAFGAYVAIRPDSLKRVLREHWLLLLFPCFTALSTIWSDDPLLTLKHSLEFILTVTAGLLLSSARNPRSMLIGMFAAFALYTALSLAVGDVVAVGTSEVSAVSGLNDSKNEQADIVGNGFLITVLVFCVGLSGRRALQCGLALITGVAQVYATLAARSAGAVGGLIFALGVFALLLTFRKAGGRGRRVIVGIASVGAVVMAMTFLWFTDDVLTWLSVAFGKDVTLTGRTYLWERASELLLEHPLVGQGFGAFWQQGNLDAEGLWRFAHITDRTGFNFHNTAYDVLIELGWCGLLLFLVSVVKGFASVAAGYVRRPSMLNCYWLSVGAFLLVRMPIETIGIYEFYFSTVLLFAIFGSAAAEPRIIRLRAPLAGQPR